ncbi:MAG TPA: hypothetical protein VMZ31_10945 [Phycisphaerae bacterium]|nr:hypothetical protein [Phycisphaerae bacterium]
MSRSVGGQRSDERTESDQPQQDRYRDGACARAVRQVSAIGWMVLTVGIIDDEDPVT